MSRNTFTYKQYIVVFVERDLGDLALLWPWGWTMRFWLLHFGRGVVIKLNSMFCLAPFGSMLSH